MNPLALFVGLASIAGPSLESGPWACSGSPSAHLYLQPDLKFVVVESGDPGNWKSGAFEFAANTNERGRGKVKVGVSKGSPQWKKIKYFSTNNGGMSGHPTELSLFESFTGGEPLIVCSLPPRPPR